MRKGTMQVWGRAACLAGALFAGGVWAGEGSRNRVAVLRDAAAGVDAGRAASWSVGHAAGLAHAPVAHGGAARHEAVLAPQR